MVSLLESPDDGALGLEPARAVSTIVQALKPFSVDESSKSSPIQGVEFGPLHEESAPEIASIDAEWNPLPWGAELFRSECNNQVSSRHGAYFEGNLIGYLFSHVVLDSAHIVSFGIHRLWRRRRIGEGLLIHSLRNMQRQGVQSVTLEVRATNVAARALYEKMGFCAVGIRRKYYSDNNEDAVTMRYGSDSL